MPLYHFQCPGCQEVIKRIFSVDQSKIEQKCIKCNLVLFRVAKGPSMQVKEILDNGVMARRVERFSDAEEIFKEHAKHGQE